MAETASASVMIVDDESVVTDSIRSFLRLETDYDVHTFQEPHRARVSRDRSPIVISFRFLA